MKDQNINPQAVVSTPQPPSSPAHLEFALDSSAVRQLCKLGGNGREVGPVVDCPKGGGRSGRVGLPASTCLASWRLHLALLILCILGE